MNDKKFVFYIEITTACNLNCAFCPSSQILNSNKYMEVELFYKIINKIKKYIKMVYFHVLGEPTLHNNFLKLLDYCENENISFGITTNGILLHEYKNDLFKYRNLNKINISLQCLIHFDDIQRCKYINNLDELLSIRKEENSLVPINLRLWNNKDSLRVRLLNQALLNVYKEKLRNNKFICISEADEFVWPSLNNPYNLKLTNCLGGKRQFSILNDGTVCLCCLDYEGNTKIGNIFLEEFSEILQKKEYIEAIHGFNNRKPYFELCKKCTYRNRFK